MTISEFRDIINLSKKFVLNDKANRYKKLDNFIIYYFAKFVNRLDKNLRRGGGGMERYLEILAEIDKQKRLCGLRNREIAKMTGLAESTINGFMTGKRYSDLVSERICNALGIMTENEGGEPNASN